MENPEATCFLFLFFLLFLSYSLLFFPFPFFFSLVFALDLERRHYLETNFRLRLWLREIYLRVHTTVRLPHWTTRVDRRDLPSEGEIVMTFGKKVDHITVFLFRSLRKKKRKKLWSDSIFFTSENLKRICGDTLA